MKYPGLGTLGVFPNELLMAIIAFTVDPPLPLESQDFDEQVYPPALLLAFYTHTQLARIRLAHVSRAVAALVLPALYGYVWLHRRGHARRLATTLLLHPTRALFIRRLDIDTTLGGHRPDVMQTSGLDVRNVIDAIADARGSLPAGLDTYVDRRATYVNVGDPRVQCPAILTRLVHAAGRVLRRAHLTVYTDPGHGHWMTNLMPLNDAHGLEILELDLGLLLPCELPAATVAEEYIAGGGPVLTLERMRQLEIILPMDSQIANTGLELLARCYFSALTALRLLGGVPGTATTGLLAFLAVHGGRIASLELGEPVAVAPVPFVISSILNVSRLALNDLATVSALPRLEHLICTVSRVHALPHPLFASGHPTVKTLGFKVRAKKP